jgi:hypothetical protein
MRPVLVASAHLQEVTLETAWFLLSSSGMDTARLFKVAVARSAWGHNTTCGMTRSWKQKTMTSALRRIVLIEGTP